MTVERRENQLSELIIGAAIEVHKNLGPGLLESVYEECLARELADSGLSFSRQMQLPVVYKGKDIGCGYRLDFMVEDLVVVELKAVEEVLPIHRSQVLTYLRLSEKWLGLLINFNVRKLVEGVTRLANGKYERSCPACSCVNAS